MCNHFLKTAYLQAFSTSRPRFVSRYSEECRIFKGFGRPGGKIYGFRSGLSILTNCNPPRHKAISDDAPELKIEVGLESFCGLCIRGMGIGGKIFEM